MRESGINHIGQIPTEWNLVKIKHLFNIGRGRVISELELNPDGEYPVYSSQTKDDGCMGYIDTFDYSSPQLTWTTDGVYAGTVFYREGKYNCTNICGTLSPKPKQRFDLRYLKYALEFIAIYHKRPDTNGAKIMNNEMANIKVPLPTLDEQKCIVNLLDRKCSNIDSIITDLEKQIEILEKYKKSVIRGAVTKGLDTNVEMKDSGVDWIGNIPKHWDTIKIKYLVTILNGKEIENDDGEIPVYGSGGLFKFTDKWLYEGISVLLGRKGTVDIPQLVFGKFWTVDTAFYTRFSKDINAEFFYYLANCFDYSKYQSGSTIPSMTQTVLNNIVIPKVNLEEQNNIVVYLNNKCSEIDSIIEDKKNQLEIIKKYKNSLIYEYVTGKKRVSQGDVNE